MPLPSPQKMKNTEPPRTKCLPKCAVRDLRKIIAREYVTFMWLIIVKKHRLPRSSCVCLDQLRRTSASLNILYALNSIHGYSAFETPIYSLRIKFGANMFNNGRVMGRKCEFQYEFCRI